LQGSCTERYGGATREYRVFDSEFLPPGHEHSLKFTSPLTRCITIEIDNSWLERIQDFGFRLGPSIHLRGVLAELFSKLDYELRIAHSCRQLSQTEASLSEISLAAGFADQSHFGRTFKRLVGITPAEYRAMHHRAKPIPRAF